ncbi:hypothetical protein C8J56DRAFT_794302 [Mycena floridula]|nr:hypothetical protein C8J56DRAFT_794302 [Mycena floridula]
MKRKNDSGNDREADKRLKLADGSRHSVPVTRPEPKPARKIKKLAPPRPFPTVPTSVSATGPRSAHKEGKNFICLTRKTPLGAYLRRCKDVIVKDQYKTLHLSAMGAAIPHLMQLAVALPPILPFSPDEIHLEVRTGTVQVHDEVTPEDEDEDVTYEQRSKSTLLVVLKIGDGDPEPTLRKGKRTITVQEPEQQQVS